MFSDLNDNVIFKSYLTRYAKEINLKMQLRFLKIRISREFYFYNLINTL